MNGRAILFLLFSKPDPRRSILVPSNPVDEADENHYVEVIFNRDKLSYSLSLLFVRKPYEILYKVKLIRDHCHIRLIFERILIEDKALDSVLRFVGKLVDHVYSDFQLPV